MKLIKKKEKQTREKPITAKKLGNRTLIGIVCILLAFATCFFIAPMFGRAEGGTVEIVRVKQTIMKGSQISDGDLELVQVGSYNLPPAVIKDKSEIIGKFAVGDLYVGEYILPERLSDDLYGTADILESLETEQKAISVTIGSFAQGLSGKLQTGDIVSLIIYSPKTGMAETPEELRYIRVITSTTSAGVDKAEVTDKSQPVTVTLLVNQEQAALLAVYEKTMSMHFTLECRGNPERAREYLEIQEKYFADTSESEEAS